MSLFCTDCGKPKKEDQQFCIFCGKSHTVSVTKLAEVDLEPKEQLSELINTESPMDDEINTPLRSRAAVKISAGVLLIIGIGLGGFLTGKSSVDLKKVKESSYNDGQQVGYVNGRTEGFNSGKTQGYNDGFNEGKTAGCNSVFDLTGYSAVLGYDPTYDYTDTNYYSKSGC